VLGLWLYYSCPICSHGATSPNPEVQQHEKTVLPSDEKPMLKVQEGATAKVYPNFVILSADGAVRNRFKNNIIITKDRATVRFPKDSSAIRDTIFKYLNANQSKILVIESWHHKDEFNTAQHTLGQLRAQELKNNLVGVGINPNKIILRDTLVDFDFNKNTFAGGIIFKFDTISAQNKTAINNSIVRKTLYTKFNSRNFTADNTLQAYASELKNYLKMYPAKKVRIEGHTDDRGEAQDNFVIARDRATNVRDYLVSQGIDATKLTAISKGETAPLTENNTEEGRSKNRRIEIIVN
jgi:outer membrane protein OmpA-like peptidoglycan-associated protein